jgi:hypothetical protein
MRERSASCARHQLPHQLLNPSIAGPQDSLVLPQRLFGALARHDQVQLCRHRGDHFDEALILTARPAHEKFHHR